MKIIYLIIFCRSKCRETIESIRCTFDTEIETEAGQKNYKRKWHVYGSVGVFDPALTVTQDSYGDYLILFVLDHSGYPSGAVDCSDTSAIITFLVTVLAVLNSRTIVTNYDKVF